MENNLLTMDLAAIRANVSITTIQRYAYLGVLPVAVRGRNRQQFFDPEEVDRWAIWFKERRRRRLDQRRGRLSRALYQSRGMTAPGQLVFEEQDVDDRERLFAAVCSEDRSSAIAALKELHQKYNRLRMPLHEQRLGINLEDI